MFPLRDTIRSRSVPLVNYGLITINALVFMFEASLGNRAYDLVLHTFGLIPANLSANPLSWIPLLSSAFLHGSWFHLISNMWILFIFGDNVEDRMGSRRYLLFYILAAVIAGLTQVSFSQASTIPTVGASGAIAGVLGAYFLLFPRSRVITLIPLFILPWFVEIPAFIYIGVWFISQLSNGLIALGRIGGAEAFAGIAWWAHIGGFVFGLLMARLFSRRSSAHARWYPDEYWPW